MYPCIFNRSLQRSFSRSKTISCLYRTHQDISIPPAYRSSTYMCIYGYRYMSLHTRQMHDIYIYIRVYVSV
ncbi:hypothetical protein CSUI_003268 [Cystoisospora suis]|uniref:Uncharacterized protein n=1 Tax=Cystoisospora suis TaxID=483139 RepID=A0A2C6L396_9APIC|nr:hypothetical protein CSUI_003268 [Cystoisospora suis]